MAYNRLFSDSVNNFDSSHETQNFYIPRYITKILSEKHESSIDIVNKKDQVKFI